MPLRMVQWSDVRSLVRTEACGVDRHKIYPATTSLPCERLKRLKEVLRVVFPLSGLTRNFLGKPSLHPPPPASLAKPSSWLEDALPKSNTNTHVHGLCSSHLTGPAAAEFLWWVGWRRGGGGAKQRQRRSRPAGGGRCSYLQPPAGGGRLPSQHSCCQEAEVLQMPPPPPPPAEWEWPGGRSGRGLLGSACTSLNGCGSPALGVHRERTH